MEASGLLPLTLISLELKELREKLNAEFSALQVKMDALSTALEERFQQFAKEVPAAVCDEVRKHFVVDGMQPFSLVDVLGHLPETGHAV